MTRTINLIVGDDEVDLRLDVFIAGKLKDRSRSSIKSFFESGLVRLKGKAAKPSHKTRVGEEFSIDIPEREDAGLYPEPIPLKIIYEDHEIIVIDKPAGLAVHPGAGRTKGTLANALVSHAKGMINVGAPMRPGIVHRLDMDTTGVLVAAKTDLAYRSLSAQFSAHTSKRRYLTLAWGAFKSDEGLIDLSIGRDKSDRKKITGRTNKPRKARTRFLVMERYPLATLLEITPETGRTHQIRTHLSSIGHPVVGDPVYGKKNLPANLPSGLSALLGGFKRQALHAGMLGITHPATGAYMEFTAPMPEDMKKIVEGFRSTCAR